MNSNRTRINARASVTHIVHQTIEGPEYPTYVTIDIRNRGNLPASIPLSFFFWHVPFKRGYWLVTPHDYSAEDQWVPQKQYPVEILPRRSKTFFLSEISVFRKEFPARLARDTFLNRLRVRFLRALVRTEDERMFKVEIDRSLWDELQSLGRPAQSGN